MDTLRDMRRNLAQLRVTYTANHPEVRRVEAQIAALEAPVEKQRENVLRRIRNEYDVAAKREKMLTDFYESQAHLVLGQSAEIDRYNFLKREVDATRTLYESMLQKMKEPVSHRLCGPVISTWSIKPTCQAHLTGQMFPALRRLAL